MFHKRGCEIHIDMGEDIKSGKPSKSVIPPEDGSWGFAEDCEEGLDTAFDVGE